MPELSKIEQIIVERILKLKIYDVTSQALGRGNGGEKLRKGKNQEYYYSLCPFHNEKTPSFLVLPTINAYHCMGCGAQGKPLNFIQEYHVDKPIENLFQAIDMNFQDEYKLIDFEMLFYNEKIIFDNSNPEDIESTYEKTDLVRIYAEKYL